MKEPVGITLLHLQNSGEILFTPTVYITHEHLAKCCLLLTDPPAKPEGQPSPFPSTTGSTDKQFNMYLPTSVF